MVVNCDIEFDNNPHGTFFAGQVLAGHITITSDKLKEVKGLTLCVNGFAHTAWTESKTYTDSNNKSQTKTETHSGHEDYIATLTYLLGSPGNSQKLRIEPGIHTYNFACQLPVTCPSSFEGSYGHVRYKVKVALERPWKFDQTYSRCFTVLKMMDLNYDSPLLRMPANTETQKTYCCWPCTSEPMKLQLSLPQTGFVAGQLIPVHLLVTNDSRIPVEETKITLAMFVLYFDQFRLHTRNERFVVAKLKGDGVLRQCTKDFFYDLRVPATPPTCLNLCRLIQITYQLEVEAKVKGWHRNEVLRVPVTIGSVPLYQVVQQQPSMGQHSELLMVPATVAEVPTTSSSTTIDAQLVSATEKSKDMQGVVNEVMEPTAPSIGTHNNAYPMPWARDANFPPPNYEEAVHMGQVTITAETSEAGSNQAQDYGEKNFTPLYPVFNVPSPSAPEYGAYNAAGGYDNRIDITNTTNGTWI